MLRDPWRDTRDSTRAGRQSAPRFTYALGAGEACEVCDRALRVGDTARVVGIGGGYVVVCLAHPSREGVIARMVQGEGGHDATE